MKLLEFSTNFPDEAACRAHFKAVRDREGVVCKDCGCLRHWWLKKRQMYKCMGCGRRTSLRCGTVMEHSKLPFMYWYMAMHLMTATKKGISALEVTRQIGHKYYEPVWELMHKLRRAMGRRDARYMLNGEIELDEGFIRTTRPRGTVGQLSRGAGSERSSKVVVMAESELVKDPKKHRKKYRCGRIRMAVVDDLITETIASEVTAAVSGKSRLRADDSKQHRKLANEALDLTTSALPGKEACAFLPWVHTAISNVKRQLLDIHHFVTARFMQNYLSEFCYKQNRRYSKQGIFERLAVAVSMNWC